MKECLIIDKILAIFFWGTSFCTLILRLMKKTMTQFLENGVRKKSFNIWPSGPVATHGRASLQNFKLFALLCFLIIFLPSDGELLAEEREEVEEEDPYVESIFRSHRVINNHSVENLDQHVIDFRVNHRFGPVRDQGAHNLFGLDNARSRLTFDYGLTDRMMVGIGRTSARKIYDGYYRVNLLQQRKDDRMPLTLTWFSNMSHISDRGFIPGEDDFSRSYRLSYVNQLIFGRQFHENFAFQISPTLVHKNLVPEDDLENTLGTIGFGGRIQFIRSSSITFEYLMMDPTSESSDHYRNGISLGVDIETAGHVFQLHFTNSREMSERSFLAENPGADEDDEWYDVPIHFGFNLSRMYDFSKDYD